MAGDNESRFGMMAGLVACVLILALTVMAMAPEAAPSVLQSMSFEQIQIDVPKPALPLPTETPSFAVHDTV